MVKVYAFEGVTPVVAPSTFVHPTASLIGDVIIGPNCYIGPGASLRGDFGRIIIGDGCNVQDNCVVHSYPNADTVIETLGHIGHGAIIHCCTIKRNTLVGMGAVVMDDAVIGEESIVAAQAFVKAGFAAPARSLLAGVPAKILRQVSDDELAGKMAGTQQYLELAKRCQTGLKETTALDRVEPGRRRVQTSDFVPQHKRKERR